jgi:hypothetical protein
MKWQVRESGRHWTDMTPSNGRKMEEAFVAASVTFCDLSLSFPFGDERAPTCCVVSFDVDRMLLKHDRVDMAVRRLSSETLYMCAFWDNYRWVHLDMYAQSTIASSLANGRKRVGYYALSEYDVFLHKPYKQTNRKTGRTRPLCIIEWTPSVLGLPLPQVPHVSDSENVPSEFCCPITTLPMRLPVVAADGRSYEMYAIRKWFSERTTSPVTGEHLSTTTLVANHNLAKMIRDWAETSTM